MEISGVELFGYFASAIIAFSLTRSSIVQLRWINLFGAGSFCAYGIIIDAYPVAILNGFITLTNIYYIRKLVFHTQHNFKILNTQPQSHYLDYFLEFHKDEINRFFPRFFDTQTQEGREYFVLLDDTQVVGILSGTMQEAEKFVVDFDFVIPQYRDCRLGEYALGKEKGLANLTHYKNIYATADSQEHKEYLIKLGFKRTENEHWYFPS